MITKSKLKKIINDYELQETKERTEELVSFSSPSQIYSSPSLFNDTYLGKRYSVSEKLISCGEFTERYEYYPPLEQARKESGSTGMKHKGKERDKRSLVLASSRRAKDIRRLIYSNMTESSAFVTLTYKKKLFDEYKAKEEINTFIRAMSDFAVEQNIPVSEFERKYIWVVERQKSGRIHFHVIFFRLLLYIGKRRDKFTKRMIREIWGRGRTHSVEAKTVINLARYLSNYTGKKKDKQYQRENLDGKCFACSRGLKRPQIFKKYDYLPSDLSLSSDGYSKDSYFSNEKYLGHCVSRAVFPIRYSCDPCAICIYSLYTTRKKDQAVQRNVFAPGFEKRIKPKCKKEKVPYEPSRYDIFVDWSNQFSEPFPWELER